jgi:hypothetical protein
VRRNVHKRMAHPVLGEIAIDCQVLHVPDTDQRIVLYVAAPDTAFHDALGRLRAAEALR